MKNDTPNHYLFTTEIKRQILLIPAGLQEHYTVTWHMGIIFQALNNRGSDPYAGLENNWLKIKPV